MTKVKAKNLYIAGVIIAVAVLASVIIIITNRTSYDPGNASKQLMGKIVCAPKKASETSTLECAYGLEASDGKNYLINTAKFPAGTTIQRHPNGTSVIVTGDVSSPAQELQIYNVEGVIAATRIVRQ